MIRNYFVPLWMLFLSSWGIAQENRPNVLLIMVDDLKPAAVTIGVIYLYCLPSASQKTEVQPRRMSIDRMKPVSTLQPMSE